MRTRVSPVQLQVSNEARSVSPPKPIAETTTQTLGGESIQRADTFGMTIDRMSFGDAGESLAGQPVQRMRFENRTGLPDGLKGNVERLSGTSLNNVRVHYNSSKPAAVQAHAFTQGSDIHVAPGQEKYLAHETWHAAQQAQGRVQPTTQFKGVGINSDPMLEKEADVMGAKAMSAVQRVAIAEDEPKAAHLKVQGTSGHTVQRALVTDADILKEKTNQFDWTSFRGKRTVHSNGRAVERGRGATLTTGQTQSTDVKWGPVDEASGEGTWMIANVGPDHNLGSAPSEKNALARVAAFSALSRKRYISGHLMNEKLGGPGDDARNLTAISASANTLEAANIETHVRNPVNKEGAWMHYEIKVTYVDDVEELDRTSGVDKARATKAAGVDFEDIDDKTVNVAVRYASQIKAQWYPLDVHGKMAAQANNAVVKIASPLADVGGKASVDDPWQTGTATGRAQAKTEIQAEELVLTKSDELKPIVEGRAPLARRIQELEDKVAKLKADRDYWRTKYEQLANPIANNGTTGRGIGGSSNTRAAKRRRV